jgi:hypothetical protein
MSASSLPPPPAGVRPSSGKNILLVLGAVVLFGIAAACAGLYFFYPYVRSFLPARLTETVSQETQQTAVSVQQPQTPEVETPTTSTAEQTTSGTSAELQEPGTAPTQTTMESNDSLSGPDRDTVPSSVSRPTSQAPSKPPVKSPPTQMTVRTPSFEPPPTESASVPAGDPSSSEPDVSAPPLSVSRTTGPDVIPVEPPSAPPDGESGAAQSQAPTTPGYAGPREGVIIWSGEVDKGETVFIEGSSTSNGQVRGSLPGVPCLLELSAPNVAVTEAPGPRNGYQRVGLRFAKKGRFSVSLKWRVVR